MDYKKYAKYNDYDDYVIFSTGKVYSLKKRKFLKPFLNKKIGYYQISLHKNKKRKVVYLHRLLGICFLENPYNLPEIDHIDINKENNNLFNLRWASKKLQQINRKIQKRNKTGVIGVRYDKRSQSYYASFCGYENYKKSFSINKYPNAKELAINWRNKMFELHYKNIK